MVSGSAIGLDVTWPKEDFAALQRAMNRAGAELGKSLPQQVKWAGWSIGVAMGTSTRVAPKTVKEFKRVERIAGTPPNQKLYWYEGKKYFGGKEKTFRVGAKSVYQARSRMKAQIKNAGLAKSSWRASIQGLGSGWNVPAKEASGRVKDKARNYAARVRSLRGDHPYVIIGSFLKYATSALKNGESGIQTVISRAAAHFEHTIDGVIRKQLKKAAGK